MVYWLNKESRAFLERGYLVPGQTPEDRIDVICNTAEKILKKRGFAKEFKSYLEKGWISLSSPVWSNFGTNRGLPISCNNSFYEDSIESILTKTAEIGMQTKMGAGTSAYLGELRPRGAPISSGGTSFGPMHFMEMLETTMTIISQSNVRRGSCAVYLPIEHPDVLDFLECREEGHAIQQLFIGVCVSDAFMENLLAGDEQCKKLWLRVIRKRFETGLPYIFFSDTVNRNAPDAYKKQKRKIYSSNLCSEILLSSSHDESFVCNLASLNALHYEDWKDSDVVKALVYFLDAVMSEYIEKTKDIPLMRTAHNFAVRQRAIGIGTLGWHSYLQSRMIPFESMAAKLKNTEIHKFIQEKSLAASQQMAVEYGEPEMLQGYGRRHMTLMAIAPTTSSSFILGQVSPSIEPLNDNYFPKDLAKGVFTYRNPHLKKLLDEKGKDDHDTWRSILLFGGSVQQLDFLSQEEKDVFKTFGEISQHEVIIQASGRQKYIDQGQSLNLKIHPKTPIKDVNALMIEAWKLGVKTLYYQHSTNAAQEYNRNLLTCVSCEA
jgi:ribonucleoside-diphosphate reductase alpha chain